MDRHGQEKKRKDRKRYEHRIDGTRKDRKRQDRTGEDRSLDRQEKGNKLDKQWGNGFPHGVLAHHLELDEPWGNLF